MRSIPKVSSAARNGGSVKMPAGREPDLIEDGAADRPRKMIDVERKHLVGARHHHRQHLAHVADDEFQPPMPVERTRQDQAQDLNGGLRMPAPAGHLQHAARTIRQIGVVGVPDGLGRQMRMDVDRNIELHRARQQRLIAGMVEKAALGGAVDERAEEAQLPDRANEFARCRIRRLHRQHGKAREPRRMARHGRRQMVVHLARDRDAVRTGHEIGAGTGVREHLQGDAGLIHRLQAPFADLGQQVDRIGAGLWSLPRLKAAPADRVPIDPADQGRHREMFLQRNNSHGRDPSGLACPRSGFSSRRTIADRTALRSA